MISGFSVPEDEFRTPYRVINRAVCHGCHSEFYAPPAGTWHWCPRYQGTAREYECTKQISVEDVRAAIKRVPAFLRVARLETA